MVVVTLAVVFVDRSKVPLEESSFELGNNTTNRNKCSAMLPIIEAHRDADNKEHNFNILCSNYMLYNQNE